MKFDEWWDDHASAISPLEGHDMEEHAKRIAELAWITAANIVFFSNKLNLPKELRHE